MRRMGLILGLVLVGVLTASVLFACTSTDTQSLPKKFKVSFETYCDYVIQPVWANKNQSINKPYSSALSRNGYEFLGWVTDSGTEFLFESTPVTQDIKLYAKWDAVSYGIKYNLDGGQNNAENPDTYTIEDEINLLNPQNQPLSFKGWFFDAQFATKTTKIKKGTTGTINLFAKWKDESVAKDVEIIFDTRGAGEIPAEILREGDTAHVPPEPQKEGYLFKGWRDKGGNLFYFDAPVFNSVTLYADWLAVEYDIEYNLDGGFNDEDNPDFYTIESEIILKNAYKHGFAFLGWFNEGGLKIDALEAGNTGKITLFARWSSAQFKIEYLLDGGINDENNPDFYAVETVTTLKDAFKNGYNFKGWFLSPQGGIKVEEIPEKSTGSITLYAVWDAIKYEIFYGFDNEPFNATNPVEYTIEDEIDLPKPFKSGYTFKGWFQNADLEGDILSKIEKGSVGEKYFYAKWEIIFYGIEYVLDGGFNGENPIAYTIEDEVILLPPLKDGHVFLGWYKDAFFADSSLTVTLKHSVGDIILYAKWAKINEVYTIDYVLDGGDKSHGNPLFYDGSKEILLLPCLKDGHIFVGWFTALGDEVNVIERGTGGNLVLYARWIKDEIKDENGENKELDELYAYLNAAFAAYTGLYASPIKYAVFVSAYFSALKKVEKILQEGGTIALAYHSKSYGGQTLCDYYALTDTRAKEVLGDFYGVLGEEIQDFLRLCFAPSRAVSAGDLTGDLAGESIDGAMEAYVKLSPADREELYRCFFMDGTRLTDVVFTLFCSFFADLEGYSSVVADYLPRAEGYYAAYIRGETELSLFAMEFDDGCIYYYENGLNEAEKTAFDQTAAGLWYKLLLEIFNECNL